MSQILSHRSIGCDKVYYMYTLYKLNTAMFLLDCLLTLHVRW